MWETWEIDKKKKRKEKEGVGVGETKRSKGVGAVEENGETGTFLFFLLYFICNLICLTERKSIYDDNPRGSNESSRVPLPWESFCWGMPLILAKWIIHTLFGHLCYPPSPPHRLQTFIHLWQFYYNLCRWLEAQEPKKNVAWRWSKIQRGCWDYIGVSSTLCTAVAILRILSPGKDYPTKTS